MGSRGKYFGGCHLGNFSLISTLLYFFLALLLLVLIHEYGHFQIARWCGVKILRFSFGFGKVLACWKDKKGTEYTWSLFPLGGYVKMQDASFNNQPLWVRMAVVVAGPLFNFLFAFIALYLILIIGSYSLAPIIASVKPNSLAAEIGLTPQKEIIALNEYKISSWKDFQYAMMSFAGSQETLSLTLLSLKDGSKTKVSLPLSLWKWNDKKPNPLASLGIEPFIPKIPPVIGEVLPDSPAAKAGLQVGDRIISIDKKPLEDWLFLVNYVKERPRTQITLGITRKNKEQDITLLSGSQKIHGEQAGFIGLRSQKLDTPYHWLRLDKQNPVKALGSAFQQTVHLTKTSFTLIGRLITGKLGLKNISGPVGIAQVAGDSGRNGLTSYLFFLALMSISLGVLNLLPIPMLDGGHLLYYVLEMIRGKPLSEKTKTQGLFIGLLFLISLMLVALTNDILRLI